MKKFMLCALLLAAAGSSRMFALDIRGTINLGDIGFGLGFSPNGMYPELRINAVNLYLEDRQTGLGLRLSPYAFGRFVPDILVSSILNFDIYYNLLRKTNWFILGPFAGVNYFNWDSRNHWDLRNILFTSGLKVVFKLPEKDASRRWRFAMNLVTLETGYRYANYTHLYYAAGYVDLVTFFFYIFGS